MCDDTPNLLSELKPKFEKIPLDHYCSNLDIIITKWYIKIKFDAIP